MFLFVYFVHRDHKCLCSQWLSKLSTLLMELELELELEPEVAEVVEVVEVVVVAEVAEVVELELEVVEVEEVEEVEEVAEAEELVQHLQYKTRLPYYPQLFQHSTWEMKHRLDGYKVEFHLSGQQYKDSRIFRLHKFSSLLHWNIRHKKSHIHSMDPTVPRDLQQDNR